MFVFIVAIELHSAYHHKSKSFIIGLLLGLHIKS